MERFERVESLFQEALLHSPGERDSWLRETCGSDDALYRDVTSLLANHDASVNTESWMAAAAAHLIARTAVLKPGDYVGHYQIVSFLAAGGMGEVYQARDPKLKRDVALKVLPQAFAQDSGRMARFQREAEVLASLNHPNIAHIYGIEERALVMEFVAGESPKGPMPFEDAWKIASQMADGLNYAHERGIVHRDLKPANVKVTPEGVVKLLDFGLAKAYSDAPDTASANPADSPTMTLGGTVPGVILGTAAYMSPEQARGRRVDKRADIWAFGVVLYELVTGKQLFCGEDLTDTLSRVVKEQPELRAVPQRMRKLLQACLEKDPKERLQSIGDIHFLLDTEPPAAARPRLPLVLGAVAAVLVVVLGAVSFFHPREEAPERPIVRFQIPAPEKDNDVRAPILSPDGRRLALTLAEEDGKTSIWVRAFDSNEFRPLPGTEGASPVATPFWSPDSRFIGFFADGKLKKIDPSGVLPQTLSTAEGPIAGGSWNQDGVIIFSRLRAGIWRVSDKGGEPVQVTAGGSNDALPWFLPDGHHFLFTVSSAVPEDNTTFLASLDGKQKKRLVSGVIYSVFTPASGGDNGYLISLRQRGTLIRQTLDSRTFEVMGEGSTIAEGVASFSVSANGTLAYRKGTGVIPTAATSQQLAWFDRAGKSLRAIGPPAPYNDIALSPDGSKVAVTRVDSGDIWILDLTRNLPTRFTFDPALDWDPTWSPDGKRLAFASRRAGLDQIYWKDSSGSGTEEAPWKSADYQRPKSWSPDGRFLLFMHGDPNSSMFNLWILPIEPQRRVAERQSAPYFKSPFNITQGQFSPEPAGAPRWVAYTSNESGQNQIYVQSFPAGASKFQISTNGGVEPRWRRDGKEIFYLSPEREFMAVKVKTAPTFEYGTPRELFRTHVAGGGNLDNIFRYDVAPDGKRFLVLSEVGGGGKEASPINVVLNWTAGLRQ